MIAVLFLDDNVYRWNDFSQKNNTTDISLTWVSTASSAISKLSTTFYDQVWLDCDLLRHHYSDLQRDWGDTGMEVAKYIANHPECCGSVIVHSLNPYGSERMHKVLLDARVKCIKQPFDHEECKIII